MHAGNYTASSDAGALLGRCSGARGLASVLHTAGWYLWSGWFFGEVWIWSQSGRRVELGWVDPGREYERARLNENPIFLRCLWVLVSLVQTGMHLVRDVDLVEIPQVEKREKKMGGSLVVQLGVPESVVEKLPLGVRALMEQMGTIINRTGLLVFSTIFFVHFPLYYILFRQTAWKWAYSIASTFFRQLPDSAPPSGLQHFPTLLGQAIYTSAMLVFLWEVSNTAFTAIVAQPPLKKREPLTSEIKDARGVVLHRSRDPNGSLLTGLKSKKPVPKAFAFWELYLICTTFESRRQTIYTEVDRAGGSTWSQICTLCLAEISTVKTRVEAAIDPIAFTKKLQEEAERRKQHENLIAQTEEQAGGLKRIADQGVLRDMDVFVKRPREIIPSIGEFTKSIGEHPGAANPVSPHARKVVQWTADAVLSKEEQQRLAELSASTGRGILERLVPRQYLVQFLRTPLGAPFRQTMERKLTSAVFGKGESGKGIFIHSVKILEKLIMASLTEDRYGSVQKDIAEVVRTLTSTIVLMEKYVKEAQPHWSDVERRGGGKGEVVECLEVLKRSLEQIVLGFGEYADTLGLSLKEVREAREAAVVVVPQRGAIEDSQRGKKQVTGSERRMEQVALRERRTDGRVERVEMEQVERTRRRRE